MAQKTRNGGVTRRSVLATAVAGGAGLAVLASPSRADDEAVELVRQLTGKLAIRSDRIRLTMPQTFPTGYTVPLAFAVDSPMTEADHVRHVRVLAPRNPIIEIAAFHFMPQRSEPRLEMRVRLAGPQHVVAVAEMSDGTLLLTTAWVEVATNGCT